jgi:hypothetical protein
MNQDPYRNIIPFSDLGVVVMMTMMMMMVSVLLLLKSYIAASCTIFLILFSFD